MKKILKKGVLSNIIKMLIAVMVLLAVYLVFFDNDGLIEKGFTQLRDIIKGVPEVDPEKSQLDFAKNNAKQLQFFSDFNAAITQATECQNINEMCVSELPLLDQNGFYDGTYNLYVDSDGKNLQLRLTQYRKLDTDEATAATETPVQTMIIPGVTPCIVKGEGATYFYNLLLNTGEVANNKDKSMDYTSVQSLKLSAEKTDDHTREIGVKINANDKDYTWYSFFKKKEKTQTYIVKIKDASGAAHVCFFPVYAESWWTIGSKCNEPTDGLIDSDCFDTDGGDYALKTNVDNKRISTNYICTSNTACKVVTPSAPVPSPAPTKP